MRACVLSGGAVFLDSAARAAQGLARAGALPAMLLCLVLPAALFACSCGVLPLLNRLTYLRSGGAGPHHAHLCGALPRNPRENLSRRARNRPETRGAAAETAGVFWSAIKPCVAFSLGGGARGFGLNLPALHTHCETARFAHGVDGHSL